MCFVPWGLIADWCNGSTMEFDSISPGSSPGLVAKHTRVVELVYTLDLKSNAFRDCGFDSHHEYQDSGILLRRYRGCKPLIIVLIEPLNNAKIR